MSDKNAPLRNKYGPWEAWIASIIVGLLGALLPALWHAPTWVDVVSGWLTYLISMGRLGY